MRIRSVHPGQWTDEEFVSCSPLARLLAIGLRNVADDGGVFEWKPKTIKMVLLPADNCNVDELLEELSGSDQVLRFDHSGKAYGFIRNFTKYQRPKFPKSIHPQPMSLPEGWGNPDPPIPPIAVVEPPDVVKEEVKEEENKKEARKRVADTEEFSRFWEAFPERVGKGAARKAFAIAVTKTSVEAILASLERYKRAKPPDRAWCHPATFLNQERWLDEPASTNSPLNGGAVPEQIAPSGPPPALSGARVQGTLQ